MSIKLVHETTNIEEKYSKSRPQIILARICAKSTSVAFMLSAS